MSTSGNIMMDSLDTKWAKLVRAKYSWEKLEIKLYLSINSGIPHSANRERDKVIELGRRISILVSSEDLVGSTLYLTYENLFKKY